MTLGNPPNPSKPSNPAGVTGKLSNWIYSTNLSTIPAQVVTRAKYLILDGVACALVGSHLPWSTIAAKSIFNMEPEGSCTVVGWGDKKLSPLAAAILNSTFIQGFELDDYHSVAPLHSNSLLLPALLSAAEIATLADNIPKTYSAPMSSWHTSLAARWVRVLASHSMAQTY